MLGYLSRALLIRWVKELAPQPRKFKRNGINLTSEEKEAAAFALLTRDRSAQKVANDIGVSRYDGEISPAVEKILQRDFKADKPNGKWVTDITEFRIPTGKVYLSSRLKHLVVRFF